MDIKNMKNIFLYIFSSLFLISLALNLQAYGQTKTLSEEVLKGRDAPPVKIINHTFGEGEDWLKGFSIEVENISNKPVYYFRYAALIPNELSNKPVHLPMIFNSDFKQAAEIEQKQLMYTSAIPLKPGEKIKIVIPENRYNVMKLAQERKTASLLPNIKIILQCAYFGDGSSWNGGNNYSVPISQLKPFQLQDQSNSLVTALAKTNKDEKLVKGLISEVALQGCGYCAGSNPCGCWTTTACLRYDSLCDEMVDDWVKQNKGVKTLIGNLEST